MSEAVDDAERVLSPGQLLSVGCLLAVAAAPAAAWLTRSTSDRWLSSAGFALAVSGLGLTLIGFIVTLWQLRRTDSATRAVAGAISRLRRDLSSLDVLTELRSAAEAAGEAQNHLRDRKWVAALASYNKIRYCLYKAVAVNDVLDADNSEKAKDFIAHALAACSDLESATEATQIDIAPLNSRLRELEGFLVPLEYKMKDTFSGQ